MSAARRIRSAITGRFVTAATGRRHPRTTITEELTERDARHLHTILELDAATELVHDLAEVLGAITADPYRTHRPSGAERVSYPDLHPSVQAHARILLERAASYPRGADRGA